MSSIADIGENAMQPVSESSWIAESTFDLTKRAQAVGATCYVLLNCLKPLSPEFIEVPEKRIIPISDDRFTRPPIALLCLDGAEDPLLPLSLQLCRADTLERRNSQVSGWMLATGDVSRIVSRLRGALNAKDVGERFMFPYYLSKMAFHLPALLTSEQWTYLYGHLQGWAALDWHGRMLWLQPPPEGAVSVSSLRFMDTQKARLDRVGVVNAALDAAGGMGDKVDAAMIERADQLVERYDREYGPQDDLNRVLFAVHGLRVHARFDRHPEVAPLLRPQTPQGQYGLAAALNRLDDAAWARIRSDLTRDFPSSALPHGRPA